MKKALFLDRDGVINVHEGYTFRKEDFVFIDGIFDLCRRYLAQDYLIIVITNQAGIAKGLYTEDDFLKLSAWMSDRFLEKGIIITKVYYCPHHPDYSGVCKCRKPEPGMLLKAAEEFDLNLEECHLAGDMESDIEAGRRAGIPEANLFLVGKKGVNL